MDIWCSGRDSNSHTARAHEPESCVSTNFTTGAKNNVVLAKSLTRRCQALYCLKLLSIKLRAAEFFKTAKPA